MSNPSSIKSVAIDTVSSIVKTEFWNYAQFIAGIVLGLIIALAYHYFVGRKSTVNSYERLLKEKDKRIADYQVMISERLSKIKATSDEGNSLLKKLKLYFKQKNK